MSKQRSIIFLFVLCGLLLLSSGCAFGTRHVTLAYSPDTSVGGTGPKTAEAAAIPTSTGKSVVLMQFADQRSDKQVVGHVRNGFGMRTADVVPVNSVTDWVTQALKVEMEKAGYQVVTGDNIPTSSADPVLQGDILTVYCDAFFTYKGEVSFSAQLKKENRDIFNKRYTGKGSAGMNWAATESGYGASLSMALADAIKNFMIDFNDMIGK